jgi:hypothetical protein
MTSIAPTKPIRLTAKLRAEQEQKCRDVAIDALKNAGINGALYRPSVDKRSNGSLMLFVTILDPTGEYEQHLAASEEAKAKGVSLSWGVTDGRFTSIVLMYPWTGKRNLRS